MLEVLRLRATAVQAIRRFFAERDYLEVDTPALVPSPGLDVHLRAFEVRDPAGQPAGWLSTSPEYQMKRLLSAGAERIFQICRSYRAAEQGPHHEREFTMLEWYRAHATSEELIAETECLVETLALTLEAPFADQLSTPWARMTVEAAFEEHAGAAVDPTDEDRFFETWALRVQPRLGNPRPVVVTDWPASMASLAKLKDNGTADRFEAFFAGVELCNGFGELTDATEQRRRFERDQAQRRHSGLPVYPIDERFIEALERGIPPSGGNALGVDRLLMVLTDAESIQQVMPFPGGAL